MAIGNNTLIDIIVNLIIYYIYDIFGLEHIDISLSVIYCFVDIRLIKSSIIISSTVDRYSIIYILSRNWYLLYLSRTFIKLFMCLICL